jgi:hypothetical protein
MTYAPQTLKDLMALWQAFGGVNLGIVGDVAHQQKGTSYHLGADDLQAGAYSATLARDRAGLTNAASAVDLGKLGTYKGLQEFSVWLVAELQKADLRYPPHRDVREVIYSPDGQVVRRWNALYPDRIFEGGTGTGHGDDSHLTHTHISFYRDSEFRDKRPLFLTYWEKDMPQLVAFERRTYVTAKANAELFDAWPMTRRPNAPERPGTPTTLSSSRRLVHSANVAGERIAAVQYEPASPDTNASSPVMYVTWDQLEAGPDGDPRWEFEAPIDCGAQVAAAVLEAEARVKASAKVVFV